MAVFINKIYLVLVSLVSFYTQLLIIAKSNIDVTVFHFDESSTEKTNIFDNKMPEKTFNKFELSSQYEADDNYPDQSEDFNNNYYTDDRHYEDDHYESESEQTMRPNFLTRPNAKYKSKLFNDFEDQYNLFNQETPEIHPEENQNSTWSMDDRNDEEYEETTKIMVPIYQYPAASNLESKFYKNSTANHVARNSSVSTATELSILNSNKYEEHDLIQSTNNINEEMKTNTNKETINMLLKRFISNILTGNYYNKDANETSNDHLININNRINRNSKLINQGKFISPSSSSTSPIDQESKYINSDSLLWNLKNKTLNKIKRLFSLFTVIQFNNTECNTTNSAGNALQGVCYTTSECTRMNGTAYGNCANNYGVCCVFRGSCGDSSSRNCSYFSSPNYPDYYPSTGGVIIPTTTVAPTTPATPDPRLTWYYYKKKAIIERIDGNQISSRQSISDTLTCTFSVYKINGNIKQFRIDFLDFDLASPTNGTCINERLIIRGQNANDIIPAICGYNTGQNIYIDVSQLNGPLQLMVLSQTGTRKRFKIRICQYSDCNIAQNNCLQYYTGITGTIQSFNYDQAAMFNRSSPGYFNNLNYAICIRKEAGYCSITYTNIQNGQVYPFQIENRLRNGQLTVPQGQAGVDILNCPDDYIIIDGTRLCGDRFNDGSSTTNFSLNTPVIDRSAGPIIINVRTDGNVTGLGFKLFYTQNRCASSS